MTITFKTNRSTKNDIKFPNMEVGKLYRNTNHPDYVYLVARCITNKKVLLLVSGEHTPLPLLVSDPYSYHVYEECSPDEYLTICNK